MKFLPTNKLLVVLVVVVILSSLGFFYYTQKSQQESYPLHPEIKEQEISYCQNDSDCIIVPYKHCCGSTKRAINKIYANDYKAHKEWQSFYGQQCAYIGICPGDEGINSVKCEDNYCVLNRGFL